MTRCLVVIPARMASTRFPGKPLVDLGGKPMIQWTYEAAVSAGVGDVLIATPDQEIVHAAEDFGAETMLTRGDHPSGTDRIAEVAERYPADVYVNVQGDEPLLPVNTIKGCAAPLLASDKIQMASMWEPLSADDAHNPAIVKVVTDIDGFALYFSRSPIPYVRDERLVGYKRHVGMYAYRRDAVMAFSSWPRGVLEATENLEQLRFMEHGVRIFMAQGESSPHGVDTPEQAEAVRQLIAEGRHTTH